jgi:hypothetical protein
MKLKLNDQGQVVVQDGKPVYVHDDGKEIPFDATAAMSKIGDLNKEAKGHRERADAAETKLKTFDGIEDPTAAIKALSIVKNLDDKKLVDAGEVERVKSEAIKAVEEKYSPTVKRVEELEGQLYGEKIGGSFSRSKFITEKLAIPVDIAQSFFGKNFKIEEGKIVATDASGNKIFSRTRPGEIADFDEALEHLVESYPNRNHILKSSGASGGGAKGAGDGSKGGAKTKSRSEFDAMSQNDRMTFSREGGKVVE